MPPQPSEHAVKRPQWKTHFAFDGATGLTERHIAVAEREVREANANTDAPQGTGTPETDRFPDFSSHSLCPVTYVRGFVSWGHITHETCPGNVRLGFSKNESLVTSTRLAMNAYHSPITATNRKMREQRERVLQGMRTAIGGDGDAKEGRQEATTTETTSTAVPSETDGLVWSLNET